MRENSMQTLSAIQKTWPRALAAAAAVLLAMPALGGGPLEPPDAGGPGIEDYTGWTPLAFVMGGRDDASTRSRVHCLNVGTTETRVAVQWYDDAETSSREPFLEGSAPMPPGDLDVFVTSGGPNLEVFARVLIRDKRARVACAGQTEDAAGVPLAALEVVYLKKIPKPVVAR
jgi:hypothetical protein